MLNACAGLLMGVVCLYLSLSADQALSAQSVTSNLQGSCADLLSECMHVSSSDKKYSNRAMLQKNYLFFNQMFSRVPKLKFKINK